jgi:hypothetical protein
MPQTLHAELARAAEREGTSLNQLIVTLLTRSVGSADEASGAGGTDAVPAQAAGDPARRQPRALTAALAVNFAVVLLAGAIAVVLLVVAWRGGF